ncbi:MAG: metalloenzyme [Thermoanaerobaculia bacterium]
MARVLLLFVDGVGLAPRGDANPLATTPMPGLARWLGGALTAESVESAERLALVPLDATLGVPGLPQSATGQTTLFTGVNAPEALGRHVTAFPGPRLAAILAEASLFRRLAARGRRATFANPFTAGYFAAVARGERRLSATTLAARAGDLPLRDLDDLAAGRAVSWDVERDHLARYAAAERAVEPIAAEAAGEHLAAIAAEHDFTLWETFATDLAGHQRWEWTPEEALRRLDGLLAGLAGALPPDIDLLLTSDHGNLEDRTRKVHTANPVPLLAAGPNAARFAGLSRLDQVAPAIEALLTQESATRPS